MITVVVPTIAAVRQKIAAARAAGRKIGFVPTMGALHAGHTALLDRARLECDFVVASIFVNPIQFDRRDDYEAYARNMDADIDKCKTAGVDLVFAPDEKEMYPEPLLTHVEVEKLGDHLCGAFRPGHFRGVATVVTKLFNIVQPDIAYFGEKDAQQLAIIRRMVADLSMAIEVKPVPTVREPDGLALSSRNIRLSPGARSLAPTLYQALQAAAAVSTAGETDPARIKAAAQAVLAEVPEMRVEYLEVVGCDDMQPVERAAGPVRVAAAVWLDGTRLIDNVAAGG